MHTCRCSGVRRGAHTGSRKAAHALPSPTPATRPHPIRRRLALPSPSASDAAAPTRTPGSTHTPPHGDHNVPPHSKCERRRRTDPNGAAQTRTSPPRSVRWDHTTYRSKTSPAGLSLLTSLVRHLSSLSQLACPVPSTVACSSNPPCPSLAPAYVALVLACYSSSCFPACRRRRVTPFLRAHAFTLVAVACSGQHPCNRASRQSERACAHNSESSSFHASRTPGDDN